jgi:ribosome biogenesis GTPase
VFNLQLIGADAGWRCAVDQLGIAGTVLARVAAVYGDECELMAGAGVVRGETTGALRFAAESESALPVTGDWVAARFVEPERAFIHAVLPRRSVFSRRSAGKRHREQPLAANIDTAMIVCALDADFNPRRLERYMTLARQSNVQPLIVLSKADLCDDVGARLGEVRSIAGDSAVVALSAVRHAGVDAVASRLGGGKTAALLGSSGAGKSTLVNALLGHERQATKPVRESDGRGRHTTTRRDLIALPGGGALIDTPGLRELQLWAASESVDEVFTEIGLLAESCRFDDCRHDSEPGCEVLAALDRGDLEPARWESWRKLRRETQRHEMLTDRAAAEAAKQRLRAVHKAMRVYKERH